MADTNALLRALLDPSLDLPQIADQLGLTLLELLDAVESHEVTQALDRISAFSDRRARVLASRSLVTATAALRYTAAAYAQSERANPAADPASLTRRRLWADTARKAANLLQRLARPAPDPAAARPRRRSKPDSAEAPTPQSPPRCAITPASCLDAPCLDAFLSDHPPHPDSPAALIAAAGAPVSRAGPPAARAA